MMPFGALPAGALAEVYGPQAVVFLGGAITLLFAAGLLLLRPSLRATETAVAAT
jgi:hypothetical protein